MTRRVMLEAVSTHPDLDRFWTAVDASEQQRLPLEDLLERQYFGPASPALAQYAAWSGLDAPRLAATYRAHSAHYLALRDRADELAPLLDVEPLSAGLARLLPAAVPAQVQLLVGDFSCAGTVGPGSILLGLEFFPAEHHRHLAPLGAPLLDANHLLGVLAHELIHVQQAERFPDLAADLPRLTLLQLALLEGAAEYLGALLSGQCANPAVHLFGQAHAAELWPLFWAQAESSGWGDWFYGVPARTNWPGDLGYFMGYELCRAYHQRYAAGQEVISEIVQGFHAPQLFRGLL